MKPIQCILSFIWKNPLFFLVILLGVLISSFIEGIHTWHLHKYIELSIYVAFLFIIYIFFRDWNFKENETSNSKIEKLFRINRFLNGFYKNNTFYCQLMIVVFEIVIVGNFYYLNIHENDNSVPTIVKGVAKVWEFSAYLVTFSYSCWFWISSPKGGRLVDWLNQKDSGLVRKRIFPSILLVGWCTFFHFLLLLAPDSVLNTLIIYLKSRLPEFFYWFLDNLIAFLIPISMLLIVLIYIQFYFINKRVIDALSHDCVGCLIDGQCEKAKFREDWVMASKCIDTPTLWIFSLLLIYSFCLFCFTSVSKEMEAFFSGSIAFELLLSSIVWANTETV